MRKSLCFLFLCALALPAPAQTAPPADNAVVSGPPVTMDLTRPSLTEIVTELGQKYGVNIVADVYFTLEMRPERVQLTNTPLKAALPALAGMFNRQMSIANGIVIWRHRDGFRATNDASNMKIDKFAWKDSGGVKVERMDGGAATARTTLTASSDAATPKTSDPARLISLEAASASAKSIGEAFTKQVGWNLTFAPDLAERRLSAQMHRVTPSAALEALTLLCDASETVAIGQTDDQKKAVMLAEVDKNKDKRPRGLKSEALKKKFLAMLTPQQKAALQNGQKVNIGVANLSPELKKQAIDFINTAFDALPQDARDSAPPFDRSVFGGFTLIINPDPSYGLSIEGSLSPTHDIGF